MAAIVRVGWRNVCSSWRRRTVSTFVQERIDEEVHALKTMVTWRNISLFVAIPAVLITAYSSYVKEMAHMKHHEEHGNPEFLPFTHLRIRNKPFPWGDGNHTLLHNPDVNPLPDGYEK